MEHREPLRIPPADRRLDAAIESPRDTTTMRWRGRDMIGTGRPGGPRRLIVLCATGLVVVLALGYLASIGTVRAVAWLHRQPYYQLPFNKIRLEPGPPPWYRGGRDAFLEAVRRSARQSTPIPRLDTPPGEIAGLFRNYHWVLDAQVGYPPGGIAVHVRYRQPVAYVQLSQGEQLIVNEKGTILPPAEVDESQLGPRRLTRITGQALQPPADLTPGVSWKFKTEPNAIPREDRSIIAAAKLAGYLRDKEELNSTQNSPALRIGEIIVSDFGVRRLFVLNDEAQVIWWREAPGEERPGEPKADEKWDMLRKWGESSAKHSLPEGDFWKFSGTEVVPVCTHRGEPHHPRAAQNEDVDAISGKKASGSG